MSNAKETCVFFRKKSVECLRGCRKVLTFAPAFEEQPRGRRREEFFDRLRQTEDRYKQRAAIEAGGWQ